MGCGRTVVALQGDHLGRYAELPGKIQDIAHRRRAEGIDGLCVVAHHRQAAAVGLHRQQDGGLQAVGVLVLVHHDVIEAAPHVVRDVGMDHHFRPVKQQVVVVQHLLGLLGFHVGAGTNA